MARLSYGTTTYSLNTSSREQNAASFLQADVDDLTDATALVFPAIGAALLLLFGGLLLTTALRCRLSDSKNRSFERTDKKFLRVISFYNTPSNLWPRGTSVFQQENNDIVDAVMEKYGDLSHYKPERDHSAKFEQAFARSLSWPEMVDKGVGSSSPIQTPESVELEKKVDFTDQRNEPASSGIDVRSRRSSFDDDSLELFSLRQDETDKQNAHKKEENVNNQPLTKHHSFCPRDEAIEGRDQRNVPLSQKVLNSPSTKRRVSLLRMENGRGPGEKTTRLEYDPSRLRRSNLHSGSDSSFGSAGALSGDSSDSEAAHRPLRDPAGSVTTENTLTRENVRRCDVRSPMRKLALEKWLREVQMFYPAHDITLELENSESDSTESRHSERTLRSLRLGGVNVDQERKRKTRTWPRAMEMRRAHLDKDNRAARKHSPPSLDHSSGSDANVGESSGSCLNHAQKTNLSRCGVKTRLYTRGSGRSQRGEKWDFDRKPSIVEKERLGSPQAICSLWCDEGTHRGAQSQERLAGTCRDLSEGQRIIATSKVDESHSVVEQQLRRSSYFGGAQILAQPDRKDFNLRGASSLDDQGFTASTCRDAQRGIAKEQLRGASFFGGTRILAKPESGDCPLRGASSLGDQRSAASTCRDAQRGIVKEQLRLEASYFVGTQILAQSGSENSCPLRGASSLGDQRSAVSTCRDAQRCIVKEQLRGASSFGGTQILAQSEGENSCPLRGASSLGDQGFAGSRDSGSFGRTQILQGASSLSRQRERRATDTSHGELRGASVFGGSQIISQVSGRTEVLGLGNNPSQPEINASEIRSACSLEDAGGCTSSIILTVARDSDEENSQCETDSLMSKRSYQNRSAVSVESSHTVIAAKTSSVGTKELEQPCKTDKLLCASSDRCDQEHSQTTDCTDWRARGYRTSCVEAASSVEGVREGSPVGTQAAARYTSSKLSSENILNVGRDISVMSAVLNALRQERHQISRDRRKA